MTISFLTSILCTDGSVINVRNSQVRGYDIVAHRSTISEENGQVHWLNSVIGFLVGSIQRSFKSTFRDRFKKLTGNITIQLQKQAILKKIGYIT